MNIEDICRLLAARDSKEAIEDTEFNESPLREYIDGLITQASKRGESKISPNFYYTKEKVLGERYGGPSIEAAIRHYSREGFYARMEHWCSPNGYGNTSLIISWKQKLDSLSSASDAAFERRRQNEQSDQSQDPPYY